LKGLQANNIFDQYELGSKIGAGKFSVVYRGLRKKDK